MSVAVAVSVKLGLYVLPGASTVSVAVAVSLVADKKATIAETTSEAVEVSEVLELYAVPPPGV